MSATEPQKISVQETKHRIQIVGEDGKPLWTREGLTGAPSYLPKRPGQTPEQVAASLMKPALFYQGIHLPRFIPKSTAGFGTSELTVAGVRQ